jgi:hypothetical protein
MHFTQRTSLAAGAAAALLCAGAVLAPAAVAATGQPGTPHAHSVRAAPSASAAYGGQCGTGYAVVNSAQIGSAGTVFLTYSSATGDNCAVTVRAKPGAAVHMRAALGFEPNSDAVVDDGQYTTYAGPVYLHAPGRCVTWRGEIAGQVAGKDNTDCARLAR